MIIADIDDARIILDAEDYVNKLSFWKAVYSIKDYMKIQPPRTQHLLIQLLKNVKKIEYNRKNCGKKMSQKSRKRFSGFLRKSRGNWVLRKFENQNIARI